jgi:predicted TIM-barrel fold metal-dependent hydrolase
MKPLFEVKAVDRKFYEERLCDFLPEKFIDIHTHIWLDEFKAKKSDFPSRFQIWPSRVAHDNPIEDLIATYPLMFPGKHVVPLIFGSVLSLDDDIHGANAYVSGCAAKHHFPALIFAAPQWGATKFEERTIIGGFLGAKVYLGLAEPYLPEKEIRIFDFLPHHQLEVLNEHGWVVMLHIPRDGRLKDPVNLAQMLEIEERYPNVKLIIAHVGRAYCPEDVGNAFEFLSETENMMFDFSANTNVGNFKKLIRAIGPKRIMFGSDLPVLRMRMRRICEHGNYVNIVPKGLYGDVSGDPHMRETEGGEADSLSFFMYEELEAFRCASEAVGLTRSNIEDVFYNNAVRILSEAGAPMSLF